MKRPASPPVEARPSLRAWLPAVWMVGALLVAWGTLHSSIPLWPRPGLRVQTFTDQNNHGHSVANFESTSGELNLAIRLDSGATWPVAGAILYLAPHGKGLNLSAPGSIHFEIGSSSLSTLQACLVEEIPGFTRDDRWQSARYDCQDLDLVPGKSSYDLPLDRFLTPAWWYATADVRPSQLGPEMRQGVVRLVVQSGDGTPLRDTRDIRFTRIEATSVFWLRSILILAAGLALSLLHYFLSRRRGRSPSGVEGRASVVFQPLEAVSYGDREREAVVQCIATSYSDPDLTLEKVSRATGVPQDRVTSHVKAASGSLFKAYLNRVRVEAARKLLSETDLPVSEIAYRVGYGNIPHFNRIFREIVGTTPSALREEGPALVEIPPDSDKPV